MASEIREKFLSFYESRGHTRMQGASLIPADPTVLLTIAGMLQFKPVFLGQAPRSVPRATTTQKCVRVSDIENIGVTARHHTFFEMLGNFSFGDYFKAEAIQMAWELSTKVLGIPAQRIWVSVYKDDEEAAALWRDGVGFPAERLVRLGDEDNFWASGPTGPCGPCSELYYDFHPERGTVGASLEDDSRFIEFYNLVFMESNRGPDGKLTPLANKNIDTGMGLERVAQILQCVPNNYETDLIFPIVAAAGKLAGLDYHSASPGEQTALKVMGDHARAVVYMVSDGVSPSNIGRGYVLRRLIRRTIMKGRLLGVKEVMLPALAETVIGLSDGCDPAVAQNSQRIIAELAREEEKFASTLEAGGFPCPSYADFLCMSGSLDQFLLWGDGSTATVSGAAAFELYDTYGFPLEITQEMAAERDIQVDAAGFEAEMAAQKSRSREAVRSIDMTAGHALGDLAQQLGRTSFIGYEHGPLRVPGSVLAILRGGSSVESASAGDEVEVILDRTPFYAESGGQVGDRGCLTGVASSSGNNGAASSSGSGLELRVRDTQKAGGGALVVHHGSIERGDLHVGQMVMAEVDTSSRQGARKHHTATHLLQSALKQVLKEEGEISQQGSMVTADRLRFDFNLHRGLKEAEVARVEELVNGWVTEDTALTTREMPLAEAKAAGAVAMFGEKYNDAAVRVVEVPGASMELCGGTHVERTAQIGAFKIVSEAGIASGVRRIEAVVGPAAVQYLNQVDGIVRTLASQLKIKSEEIPGRVAALAEEAYSAQKEVAKLRAELALAKSAALADSAATTASGARVVVSRLDGIDNKALQEAAKGLQERLGDDSAVALMGVSEEGKVAIVVALGGGAVKKGLKAGAIAGNLAKLCGGGGGGRPNLATAGGKDPAGLPAALEAAETQLMEQL
ncbi:alanyl-tRNA synthetase [Coccomyxa subellipsoidea C-169]|uniref:Alanine--tRNA ligase n=1 Tax=Coccomyxa subellipsoidea (strain C-169) TaxID=574566 RepID=I0YQ54_COCSC|nr:alanyl-tRNA synthetase [Coccomyxa subellipsoidea C-169]EIE20523.1 alanyl-tRNA synthetase [Coccomyxa subellipsoidea C-169]|eukprot:XP_005645067.1 alanyl-tRNA synthetase [Coccomyxa subellipsoidea C-169]